MEPDVMGVGYHRHFEIEVRQHWKPSDLGLGFQGDGIGVRWRNLLTGEVFHERRFRFMYEEDAFHHAKRMIG